ncbi:hypothetical protein [Nocardioides sp. W7]|uniref:hypothetical protein n=1 Tax=Nocardioides sp. W7 TaxID=2931390 RepID=UPI001FD57675|nr:hypothetical protein [Nocardioides sp. W7]
MTWGMRFAVALLALASLLSAACTVTGGSDEPATGARRTGPASGSAPEACLGSAEATRDSIEGTPVWARFCPGPEGRTALAEVPSDALVTHLDLLAGLHHLSAPANPAVARCDGSMGRTYRVQLGYADGRVATVGGHTDPACAGQLAGDGALVGGPETLGVYGAVMTAFGRQYADESVDAPSGVPLVCPEDPREPDSVDLDGASASLDTGYVLGQRRPMIMPLPAVRGIVCTWPFGTEDDEPEVRVLTGEEAERVRIGLHAIAGGTVDCEPGPEPTHTAVVEDRTGTRRAVTILESECSTVIRSDEGYGLGFAWLDR